MPSFDKDRPSRPGRPPAGVGENGKPERVSKYPKLTVSMKPATKARLEAYSTLTRQPAWRIIEAALNHYLESIPADDKWAVEGMVKRMQARRLPQEQKTVA